jgi:hypothetical protein
VPANSARHDGSGTTARNAWIWPTKERVRSCSAPPELECRRSLLPPVPHRLHPREVRVLRPERGGPGLGGRQDDAVGGGQLSVQVDRSPESRVSCRGVERRPPRRQERQGRRRNALVTEGHGLDAVGISSVQIGVHPWLRFLSFLFLPWRPWRLGGRLSWRAGPSRVESARRRARAATLRRH